MTAMEDPQTQLVNLKRKRSSPSISSPALPPQKIAKPTNALQINYLARQSPQDLPLINKNETIPSILDVLSAYSSVLDRHESLASNLGARPLGPILIKRFERCFDAAPDIIASHSHARDSAEAPHVTWLEVIQFAQSHPGQFTLSTFSEGRRVCQFYYPQKQVRVQVSEEDYLFIKSGRCQDLIPPLPIWEDEEKEVGTCEILEKQLRELTNAADAVAARTRQLAHRLRGRRMAIMERRADEKTGHVEADPQDLGQEPPVADTGAYPNHTGRSSSAVVNRHSAANGDLPGNGEPTADVSVRSDLLRHFQSLSQNQNSSDAVRRLSSAHIPASASPTRPSYHREPSPPSHPLQAPGRVVERHDPLSYYLSDSAPLPPVSIPTNSRPANAASHSPTNPHHVGGPGQPTSKHNFSRPLAPGAEMAQPFRSICQAHMESLGRGARVMPPCDRCRRLKMDCLKNLTSCQGCTKKHARCHWREVDRSEVKGLEGFGSDGVGHDSGNESGAVGATANAAGMAYGSSGSADERLDGDDSEDEGMGALEDLEALERQSEEEEAPGQDDKMDVEPKGSVPYTVDQDDKTNGHLPAEEDHRPVNGTDKARVEVPAGTDSVANDRPRDIFSGGLPYPPPPPASVTGNAMAATTTAMHPPASNATAPTATAVPAPAASMPPPPRERQGSYGFPPPPPPPLSKEHNHLHALTAPPLNTSPAKPEKYVHVSTPHPSYRPSAFTSVNANAFNGVNGDSSVSAASTFGTLAKPPVPKAQSSPAPPHKPTQDDHPVGAGSEVDRNNVKQATPSPVANGTSSAAAVTTNGATNGSSAERTQSLSPRSTPVVPNGTNTTTPTSTVDLQQQHPAKDLTGATDTPVAAPPVVADQSVAVGPGGGAAQGWRGA